MLAIILHAWYQKPDGNWYPWLKKELEAKGYEVAIPELPTMDTDLPDMAKQLEFIFANYEIKDDTLIIGHSLGTLLAMRIAEQKLYDKMVLISGWDFNDLTAEHKLFWPNPIDHQKIKANTKSRYAITSDNDPYFTQDTVESMAKRLAAKCILIPGKGHFTNSERDGFVIKLPEVLGVI